MGLKSDKWIRKQSDKFGMIEPYEGGVIRHTQSGHAILSYGTSKKTRMFSTPPGGERFTLEPGKADTSPLTRGF